MAPWKRCVFPVPLLQFRRRMGSLALDDQEINHSGDGGIYAELVRNRAFQGSSFFPTSLDGWEAVNDASMTLQNLSMPLSSALPTSVNVKGQGVIGLKNLGWWGIDVQPKVYSGSFYVKGDYHGKFTAALQSYADGHVWAEAEIESESVGHEWTQHHYTLVPHRAAPNVNNTLTITFDADVSWPCLNDNERKSRMLTNVSKCRKRLAILWTSI